MTLRPDHLVTETTFQPCAKEAGNRCLHVPSLTRGCDTSKALVEQVFSRMSETYPNLPCNSRTGALSLLVIERRNHEQKGLGHCGRTLLNFGRLDGRCKGKGLEGSSYGGCSCRRSCADRYWNLGNLFSLRIWYTHCLRHVTDEVQWVLGPMRRKHEFPSGVDPQQVPSAVTARSASSARCTRPWNLVVVEPPQVTVFRFDQTRCPRQFHPFRAEQTASSVDSSVKKELPDQI
jgi:hypothetical protein